MAETFSNRLYPRIEECQPVIEGFIGILEANGKDWVGEIVHTEIDKLGFGTTGPLGYELEAGDYYLFLESKERDDSFTVQSFATKQLVTLDI